jgi:outer membrane biosynthesis protein TonB
MIDDTSKPAETPAAAPTAVENKPQATKPPARKRPVQTAKPVVAKPTRKPASPAAKPATTTAKKTVRRPATTPKVAPAKKAAPTAKPAPSGKSAKPAKARKVKLVRDSFTMPETEYAVIALLKKRCLKAGVFAKKSEILRAAVAGLMKLSDASVLAAIRRLEVIKTGRPAKGAK